jgi:tryptophanase
MQDVTFFGGDAVPLEMHKVRIVQKLNLISIDERVKAVNEAGNNTFLLQNKDVFLDMLTDSGVNAMSDRQLSAMMLADDSYAGSATYYRLEDKLREIFGTQYFLPAHQGRACEHILARVFVKEGHIVPMNYHFTTTKAHIALQGGRVVELHYPEALVVESDHPFKGNMSPELLKKAIAEHGTEKISFVRMEAGTNLIGGQPFSLANLKETHQICKNHGLLLVLDASLLADNLYFIKVREDAYRTADIREITREMADHSDIIYFSARKLGHARGGGMCTNNHDVYMKLRELVPLFEGFMTYGGMSVREMEAIAAGLDETMDFDMLSQGPKFIAYMVDELKKRGIPVVTPAGGLGCHLNAMEFAAHIPQSEYPAGALGSALFIAGGIRGMERGTLSEQREPDGSECYSNMELFSVPCSAMAFLRSSGDMLPLNG